MRPVAGALALALVGAAPLAAAAEQARLAVTILETEAPAVQLRLRIPAALEPEIDLANRPGEGTSRLVMVWPCEVSLARPLPDPAAHGGGAIRALALHASSDGSRLELELGAPVRAQLRRVADSWVLRLEPDESAAAPRTAATAPPAAPAPLVARPAASPISTAPAHAAVPREAAAAPLAAPASLLAGSPPRPVAAAPAQAAEPRLAPAAPAGLVGVPPRPAAAHPAPAVPLAAAAATPAAAATGTRPAPPVPVPAPPAQAAGGATPEQLLVDVTVNGRPLADVVRAELWPGRAPLLPADAWAEARLAPQAKPEAMSDGTPAYPLDAIPGATWTVDRQQLRLAISVPAAALSATVVATPSAAVAPPRPPRPGAVLNYDLSASSAGNGSASAGAFLEAMAFGRAGNLVNSVLLRSGEPHTVQRLDTFWRYDMPGRMQTLVVGDTLGVGGAWSRPVRYAGVRWGRDFAMRPGFVTLPQLALAGEAALPSTVDVLVNNARRLSEPVPPGPFQLTNVPLVTGAGEINLVVRDLLGNETIVRQNYYASPRLLAPGLTDFSFEAGKMRFGYGADSHYRDGFAAATARAGLTRSLTGEARVELQAQRRAAGVELAGLLGGWAVGRLAVAHSQGSMEDPAASGTMLLAGVERSTLHGGAAIEYLQASAGFAPFGELALPGVAGLRPRQRLLASAGGPLGRRLSGGVSYVRQVRWDGQRLTLGGLSLSMPVAHRASMNVSLNKRFDGERDWAAAVSLVVSTDDGGWLTARADRDDAGRASATLAAAHAAPAGPGLGWNVQASTQQRQRARAALQYNTSAAELAGELASDAGGRLAARAGARGSLGVLAGLPFASRPIGQGSFAVVEVPGMAGVPIKRSHQVVATTGSGGMAFVPGLLPWQKNLLEIDPDDLPLDVSVGDLSSEVTPYAGSGVVVKFDVRRTRQALVVLHQPGGQPVPVGARVRVLPGGAPASAGKRGEIWLPDLPAGPVRLQVDWPGGACRVDLPPPAASGSPERVGPLACVMEAK